MLTCTQYVRMHINIWWESPCLWNMNDRQLTCAGTLWAWCCSSSCMKFFVKQLVTLDRCILVTSTDQGRQADCWGEWHILDKKRNSVCIERLKPMRCQRDHNWKIKKRTLYHNGEKFLNYLLDMNMIVKTARTSQTETASLF